LELFQYSIFPFYCKKLFQINLPLQQLNELGYQTG
jgi:hypothetical protein